MVTTIEQEPLIDISQLPARYNVTDAYIAELASKYEGLCIEDEESYEVVKAAVADVTKTINKVENMREKFKKPALDYGRAVDAEAKRITAALEKVRKPLADEKASADQMRHEAKMALIAKQEAEEKARLQAIEDARLAEIKRQNDEIAAQRAELEAEKAKMAEAQKERDRLAKVESDRIAADQARVAAEQKAAQDKIDAERKAIDKAKRDAHEAADRAEFEKQAKIKADKDAQERLEAEQICLEEERVRELDRQEVEAKRIAAMMPDVDRVHQFAKRLRDIECSPVTSPEALVAVSKAIGRLNITATDLENFKA